MDELHDSGLHLLFVVFVAKKDKLSTLVFSIGKAVETAICVDCKIEGVKVEGWKYDVSLLILHLHDYFAEGKGIGYGDSREHKSKLMNG